MPSAAALAAASCSTMSSASLPLASAVDSAGFADDFGDYLVFHDTGAYGASMASNYNMVERPPVVAVTRAGTRTIVRRESLSDLMACDVG